jgi:hypothetical protein
MSQLEFITDFVLPPNSTLNPENLIGTHFDPKVHLEIKLPNQLKNLKFEDVLFPNTVGSNKNHHLAYSEPFRILSDSGVKAARDTLEYNFSDSDRTSERASKSGIGLGFASHFHQEFAYSQTILPILNDMANDTLCPHNMTSNFLLSTNKEKTSDDKDVDTWRLDNVDYILIIMLSDSITNSGDEFRILQSPNTDGSDHLSEQQDIPSTFPIDTLPYIPAGEYWHKTFCLRWYLCRLYSLLTFNVCIICTKFINFNLLI